MRMSFRGQVGSVLSSAALGFLHVPDPKRRVSKGMFEHCRCYLKYNIENAYC